MANNFSTDFESGSSQDWLILDATQSGLDITGDMTITSWVKAESQPATGQSYFFVTKWSAGQESYFTGYREDGGGGVYFLYFGVHDGTTNTSAQTVQTLTNGTWFHVAYVYTAAAGTCEFYVNGVSLETEGSQRTSIRNGSATFSVGALGATSNFFDGLMNDVRIWSRALTDSDVSSLYADGCGFDNGANIVSKWFSTNNNAEDEIGSNDLTASVSSPTFSADVGYVCGSGASKGLLMLLGAGK